MRHWQLSGSTALALLLTAPAALAVTPEEVWANWQKLIAVSGTLSGGTATRNGDTLEVTGLTFAATNPDVGDTVSTSFDKISFRDRGDGTVEITLPSTYPFTITGASGSDPAAFTVTTDNSGLSLIASGTAEATSYDATAASYGVTAGDFKDATGKPLDLTLTAAMTGLAGKYSIAPEGELTAVETSGTVETTSLSLKGKNPEDAVDIDFALTLDKISSTSKAKVLDQARMADMQAALKAGFMVDSSTSVGPFTLKGNVVENGKPPVVIDAKLSGLSGKVALDATRVDYGFGLTGADFHLSGPDIPVPDAATAFAEMAFSVMLPLAVTDTPQDFSALVKLVDVTAADGLWAMADPMGKLKRDPATVILDLKGKGRWTADILDPAVQNSPTPPMELASLDLPQLLLKALGGEVAATGALTFDNTDLVTFGGLPAPTGKITANLKGINALIDTAVSMGLVPEDEVMGLRMGLAMFAKPGAEPDTLISEVEFKDKHLYVNGQMLQ